MKIVFITFRLAFRNLLRNKRRTLLTVAAISFSLICLEVFGALKDGLHQEMVKTATQFDIGAIQILPRGRAANLTGLEFLPPMEMFEEALAEAGVSHYAGRLTSQALMLGPLKSGAVRLSGVVMEEEQQVTLLSDSLVLGEFPRAGKSVLLGKRLAVSLGVSLHDEVTLVAQDIIGDPVSAPFQIAGIYETGVANLDQTQVYLPLEALQMFLNAPGKISEIAIRTPLQETQERRDLLARIFENKSGKAWTRVKVESWDEVLPDVKQLIDLNSVTMNILIGIVFIIVAMGIANTMTTITFERFREFGAMAAMGTTPAEIVGLVSMESLLLGLVSSVIGTCIGFLLCLYLEIYGIDLTQFTSANQYFANNHILRAVLTWENFFTAQMVTLAVSFLAGLYPAWRASRQDPCQALVHI